MECPKCGSQAGDYKSDICKKPGKNFGQPWKGWKCANKQCGNMVFFKTDKNPVAVPAAPAVNNNGTSLSPILQSIDASLRLIADLLAKQVGKINVHKSELEPDENVPF